MSFSQALSGLSAQSESLQVIGNNISNSQTVGFKAGDALFADVFAGANSKIGLGTRVSDIRQDFTAGGLESTGRQLDLAISGEGFFRLEQPNGEAVYSRNGQFSQDADGFIVNATGQRVTGFPEGGGAEPEPIQIDREGLEAQATGTDDGVKAVYNLDAGASSATADQQSVTLKDAAGADVNVSYNFANSFTTYDSLGNQRIASAYFSKQDPATNTNTWDVRFAVDGVVDNTGNQYTIGFNNDGTLDPGSTGNGGVLENVTFTAADLFGGEPNDLVFDFDLNGTTQFAGTSTQNSLTQDGYAPGSLAGFEVQDNGTIQKNYTNGESRDAGQIALASFVNPEGLQPDGDNNFRETAASGQANNGTAGAGLLGTIESGVIESSNVDLATELVDTIVAQRAYQANSTSISTQDELLQTVIQL